MSRSKTIEVKIDVHGECNPKLWHYEENEFLMIEDAGIYGDNLEIGEEVYPEVDSSYPHCRLGKWSSIFTPGGGASDYVIAYLQPIK